MGLPVGIRHREAGPWRTIERRSATFLSRHVPENTPRQDRDPVSLAPLTPEEALRALLAVKPDDEPAGLGDARLRQVQLTAWLAEYEGLSVNQAIAKAKAEGRTYRVVWPSDAITADLQFLRLNLELDAEGNLASISAG